MMTILIVKVIIVSLVPVIEKTNAVKRLQKIFRRYQIVDMNMRFQTLKTKSRMSIFRRLREIGYLSSYTHTGRYYTLSRIPQFDNYGLWFYQALVFPDLAPSRTQLLN